MTATTAAAAAPTVLIVERAIHAPVGRSGFAGPDTEVRVVIVPAALAATVTASTPHTAKLAASGVQIVRVGTGYRAHNGPRSALGRARVEARRLADEYRAAN